MDGQLCSSMKYLNVLQISKSSIKTKCLCRLVKTSIIGNLVSIGKIKHNFVFTFQTSQLTSNIIRSRFIVHCHAQSIIATLLQKMLHHISPQQTLPWQTIRSNRKSSCTIYFHRQSSRAKCSQGKCICDKCTRSKRSDNPTASRKHPLSKWSLTNFFF